MHPPTLVSRMIHGTLLDPLSSSRFGWKTRKCECDVLDVFLILLRREGTHLFVLLTRDEPCDCNFVHFSKELCDISESIEEETLVPLTKEKYS